jgi:tetratricopeptide (TPR) repeat protein
MRDERAELLTVLPPLDAYRRDLACLGLRRLSPGDGSWIAAAVALSRVSWREEDGRTEYLEGLSSLLDTASGRIVAPYLDTLARPSPPLTRRARILAEQFEESSAWHLALSVLAIVERELSPGALDTGRIRAQRARIQWKSGAMKDAEHGYRDLIRWGRKLKEPELIARAYTGLASVSHVLGNYPAVARWAKRAVTVTRDESLTALHALAHQLLMVSFGQRGYYVRALAHGWTAFETALGDPVREAEMLLNLAHLIGTVGEHRAALAGFVAALEREPPARIALPAWSGIAMSASHLGERRLTRRAAEHTERLVMSSGLQYARASALTEAAEALERLHLDAGRFRRAALELADVYPFNEIDHRLGSQPTVDRRDVTPLAAASRSPGRLDSASTAVITAVDALADVQSSRVLA